MNFESLTAQERERAKNAQAILYFTTIPKNGINSIHNLKHKLPLTKKKNLSNYFESSQF